MKAGKIRAGNLLLLYLIILASSCSPVTFDTSEELTEYLLEEEHGFVQHYAAGQIKMQLVYRPTDLLVAQELGKNNSTDSLTVSRLRGKYKKYAYFILSISKEPSDASYQSGAFTELLQNMSFRLSDFVIATNLAKDTIPLADFHFSRTYGMHDEYQTLLAFSKDELDKKDSDWIEIQLKDVGFGYGMARFRFDPKVLAKEPCFSWK